MSLENIPGRMYLMLTALVWEQGCLFQEEQGQCDWRVESMWLEMKSERKIGTNKCLLYDVVHDSS